MAWRVLAVNPGSTSTKIGLFEGDRAIFTETVAHDASVLDGFSRVSDQLEYRKRTILQMLERRGLTLEGIDAFVGRGGGLLPVEGGTYEVDETLLADARRGANGVEHPAQLGSQIAAEFAFSQGKPAFVVNPPDTDELCDLARMTGVRGIYRHVHLHALNLKETAIRHAAALGRRYEDCNFIVCHIGGGISISAHERGRMIDGNDIIGGEGPLAPTRCGSVPVIELARYLREGRTVESALQLCQKQGGFVSWCDTSDAREIERRMSEGDVLARRVYDAMLYQIEKWIGAMACALGGKVDAILLGGGMVHSEYVVQRISAACDWIAPVSAYPGEFELEAMAAGACRVLDGVEPAKRYTGRPAWSGFSDEVPRTA